MRSLEKQILVNNYCDQFESELKDGESPDIQQFLNSIPEAENLDFRKKLLTEFIELRLNYCRDNFDSVATQLTEEFPDKSERIRLIAERRASDETQGDNETTKVKYERKSNDRAGQRIGQYQLIREIGEGGMGSVWLAEQKEPVRRRVALKLIRDDIVGKNVVNRFEAERQALSLMSHPSIAKVLGAGETETGSPYFVMELIDGLPINEYCDQKKLTLSERLRLMVQACNAVQHAHQKGVIHRDLKPSNILITETDGKPFPKIIDFGLAKAFEQDVQLTKESVNTELGFAVGTLQYMSPEQAQMNPLGVDTRTDIYALGVILFDLLVGSTPITKEQVASEPTLKILKQICEVDPPRPSVRLRSLDTSGAKHVATARNIDSSRFEKLLSSELDWVTMRALEKKASRRYDSANELANDIERYLNNEPVLARPPSKKYLIGKFVNKNRGAVIAGTLVLLSLIAGIAGTTWGLFKASQEAANAKKNLSVARDAIANYITSVAENPKLDEEDFTDLKKELLESTSPFVEALRKSTDRSGAADFTQAISNKLLGVIQHETGEFEKADASFTSAVDLLGGLLREKKTPEYYTELASVQIEIASLRELESNYVKSIEYVEKARSSMQSAKELGYSVADADWFKSNCRLTLGRVLQIAGRSEEAIEQFSKATEEARCYLEMDSENFDSKALLGRSLMSTAVIRRAIRQNEQARKELDEAVSIFRQLLDSDPRRPELLDSLSGSLSNLASLLTGLGQFEAAEKLDRESVAVIKSLADTFPSSQKYQRDYAASLYNSSGLHSQAGRHEEAIRLLSLSEEKTSDLSIRYPKIVKYQALLSDIYTNSGLTYRLLGDDQKSIQNYDRSINASRQLVQLEPNEVDHQYSLGLALNNVGNLHERRGNRKTGLKLLKEGFEVLQHLVDEFPDVDKNRLHLGKTCNNLGNLFIRKGQFDDAGKWYEKASDMFSHLIKKNALERQSKQELSKCKNNMAVIAVQTGRYTSALKSYEECRELRMDLINKFPEVREYRADLSNVLQNMVAVSLALGKKNEALELGEQSLEIAIDTAKAFPQILSYQYRLATLLGNLGDVATQLRKDELAIQYYEKSNAEFLVLTNKFSVRPAQLTSWAVGLENLAKLRLRRSEFREAKSAVIQSMAKLDRALELAPDEFNALVGKASAFFMLAKIQNGLEPDEAIGHFDHAIELAEQLLKKQPELKEVTRLAVDSLSLRSKLLAKNGELDLAIADIERAKELIDDPDLNLDRHKEMLELRKVFRAELSKYESGELKPKNAMETLALARELTCDRHKNYATALKLYQELFEGDFKQAEAFNSELAWIEGAECALALALQDGVKQERKVELFTTTREILSQRVAMFHEAPAES